MTTASNTELAGLVVLILIFSVGTLRYIVKAKQDADSLNGTKSGFADAKSVHLWWVVDDVEGNARQWLDWSSRLLKKTRSPFLNIHLRRCKEFHEKDFTFHTLLGRDEVHAVLREHGVEVPAEADVAPSWLWKAWASAQMVTYVGGLWIDSRVLFIKPITPVLGVSKAMRFGTDPEEERGSRASGTISVGQLMKAVVFGRLMRRIWINLCGADLYHGTLANSVGPFAICRINIYPGKYRLILARNGTASIQVR